MASGPRIVAELGRPETPEERADRKAAATRTYRQSQTLRNLIAALLVTMAVVAVVYFGVPRGSLPDPAAADVAASARNASASIDHTLIVPSVPQDWRANSARLEGSMWRIVYAPPTGYVRVAQGIDADPTWTSKVLGGLAPTGRVTIDGLVWDEYTIATSGRTDTVSYAISTAAGTDMVLIYGATDARTAAVAATGVTDQIRTLREETR